MPAVASLVCAATDCDNPVVQTQTGGCPKRYCTDACARRQNNRNYRSRRTEQARCKGCGMPFMRSRSREQVYCSLSCQYESRSKEYRQREDILANVHRAASNRDALLGDYYAALRSDPCSLCGKRGDIEVDHIDARSRGGANHWENYAALCSACNALKGDKPLLGFWGGVRRPRCTTRGVCSSATQARTAATEQAAGLRWRRGGTPFDLRFASNETAGVSACEKKSGSHRGGSE